MSAILRKDHLPRHVAIIMDGNGRWAQRRGLSRVEGHKRGKKAVRTLVEVSRDLGLAYLTLYAFSTENWQRPSREVQALMRLLHMYLRTELARMMRYNIRLQAIGRLDLLPTSVRRALEQVVRATEKNTGLTVILAVSYGAREEIVHAARMIAQEVAQGNLDPGQIDESHLTEYLWTREVPDPDLLIRTGGEMRLSNFLLWQLAYTELYVTETLWPDFGRTEFIRALTEYQSRERRFGRVQASASRPELKRAAR